jgi:hypothetical protein
MQPIYGVPEIVPVPEEHRRPELPVLSVGA